MIRKAFLMQVFPDQVEEYEKRHNPIWQELSDVFAARGVHNYSIFHDQETHLLFGYVEIEDETQWASIASTEVCRRWWESMKPLMKYHPDGTPWSRDLREVFHVD